MTETQFKTKVVKHLKKHLPGAWVHHPSETSVSGIPDIFVLYKGILSVLELKVGRNKASKIQLYTLEKLANAGAITAICYTIPEVDEVIKKVLIKSTSEYGPRLIN